MGERQRRAGRAGTGLTSRHSITSTASESWFGASGRLALTLCTPRTRHDSGEKTGRNGRISKAGDTTVRKAVVEGLASLPNYNKAQKHLAKGCEVSAAVEAEACLCNSRNVDRYKSLVKRGKRPNVSKVAVASELVRQTWAIGNIVRGELELGRPRASS